MFGREGNWTVGKERQGKLIFADRALEKERALSEDNLGGWRKRLKSGALDQLRLQRAAPAQKGRRNRAGERGGGEAFLEKKGTP